jgi:hypothetical protein
VVAVLGLAVVAAAYGATKSGSNKRSRTFAAACAQLLKDPQAAADMQALRAEHRAEMQVWWSTYGNDRGSAAAQSAFKVLRAEHWSDMKALFEKYGVKLPANAGPGNYGFGMMGAGGCGGAGCGPAGAGCGGAGQGAGFGGMMGGGMMGGWTY